jgi:hypothetical protein
VSLVFVAILEIMVRRYSFAYRRPLWYSVLGIIIFVFLGGALAGRGSLEQHIIFGPGRGGRPPALLVRHGLGSPPDNIYRVRVVDTATSSIVVMKVRDRSTSTVLITPDTRLPLGSDFEPGDMLVIFGENTSGTIRAFGIQEIEPGARMPMMPVK